MSATVVSRYPRSPIDAARPSRTRSRKAEKAGSTDDVLSSAAVMSPPDNPCALLVPTGTVLHIPTVHRSTRETAGSGSPMTDTAVTVEAKTPTTPGKTPPAIRLPKPVQMVLMTGFRRRFLRYAHKRYGAVFAINVPFFGRSVVVSDPALARQVFLASADDLINVQPNLSRIFGPGSVFALNGKEHRARRKLLAPPFH